MQRLIMTVLAMFVIGFTMTPTAAEARDCYGCTCTYECWKNGKCRTVCRDSCGQFCFADEEAAPEALNYTPIAPSASAQCGVAPSGKSCPASHPIKGNFTTYDGSRCIVAGLAGC